MPAELNRRGFLEALGAGATSFGLGTLLGITPVDESAAQTPIKVQPANNNAFHLPRSYEGIRDIADEQTKVMLAAVTASGGESIAYYKRGDAGEFTLDKHVELYPDHTANFSQSINYKPATYETPEVVRQVESGEDPEYHIPVYLGQGDAKQLEGVLVIKPPMDDFGHVLGAGENPELKEMYEEARIRQAKLKMAEYITNEHSDLFGEHTKDVVAKHKTIDAKKQYFTGLIKAMFETFPLEENFDVHAHEAVKNAENVDELHDALREVSKGDAGSQASHVLGVSELMNLGMKAVNEAAGKQVINEEQRELGVLITLLHDVGKTQFASTFMQGYPSNTTEEQRSRLTDYFIDHNHDHPVLSMVTMLTYPEEAVTAAAHHHGLFRYTPKNLYHEIAKLMDNPIEEIAAKAKEFGQAIEDRLFNTYSILGARQDIKPDQLPALSRMMRVADVAEAISGRVSIPLPYTLVELEKKVVATRNKDKPSREKDGADAIPEEELEWRPGDSYEITPDTIDPDYLCFMIDHGVFNKYGEIRDQEHGGKGEWKSVKKRGHEGEWSSEPGDPMHQPEKTKAIGEEILKRYHWEERKEEVEARIIDDIAKSAFIQANSPQHQRQIEAATAR